MAPVSVITEDVIAAMCDLMQTTPMDGCVVEVGVYKGGSLHALALARQGRPLFAYDTFCGIPCKSEVDSHVVGDFGDTSFEAVRALVPDAQYGVGVFPSTLLDMPPIAFAHIDCDQYDSVRSCMEVLGPKMMPGGIMWLDDYNCLEGARRAVEDVYPGRAEQYGRFKFIIRF